MNYLQALFSIFNAPLFATFIIGMFWKRMTPAAGFWGLIAGTITAAGLFVGYKAGWIGFGSDLDESMWGAGMAFVVDAIVTVRRSRCARRRSRSRSCRAWSTAWPTNDEAPREYKWWESPKLLGVLDARGRRHPDDRVVVGDERHGRQATTRSRRARGQPVRPAPDHRRPVRHLGRAADDPRDHGVRRRGGQGRRRQHQPLRRARDARRSGRCSCCGRSRARWARSCARPRRASTGRRRRAAAPHGVDAAALASKESRRRARGDSQGGRRPRDPGGQ